MHDGRAHDSLVSDPGLSATAPATQSTAAEVHVAPCTRAARAVRACAAPVAPLRAAVGPINLSLCAIGTKSPFSSKLKNFWISRQ